jgi:disulfide bond formation protein DsbB
MVWVISLLIRVIKRLSNRQLTGDIMKIHHLVFIVAVIAAALLVACAPATPPPPTYTPTPSGDAAAGKTAFEGTCSACHGMDAKGVPGLGKDLTISQFVISQSEEQFLSFLKTGRPSSDPANTTGIDMPPKGGNPSLDDEDLLDIIAYIRSIHQ